MKIIDDKLIQGVAEQAKQSPRLRMNYNFHESLDEKKGLKWIHKATFQGYQPAIDYCKEHGYKWY